LRVFRASWIGRRTLLGSLATFSSSWRVSAPSGRLWEPSGWLSMGVWSKQHRRLHLPLGLTAHCSLQTVLRSVRAAWCVVFTVRCSLCASAQREEEASVGRPAGRERHSCTRHSLLPNRNHWTTTPRGQLPLSLSRSLLSVCLALFLPLAAGFPARLDEAASLMEAKCSPASSGLFPAIGLPLVAVSLSLSSPPLGPNPNLDTLGGRDLAQSRDRPVQSGACC